MGHHETSDGPTRDVESGSLLHVNIHRLPAAAVVTAVGEVDMSTAAQLAVAVQAQFHGPGGLVVIDLSGVTFLGSSGLAVLIEARQTADESGRSLRIVGNSRAVIRTVEAAGLSDHLSLLSHLDEALSAE